MTSPARSSRPDLVALAVPAPAQAWEAAGFTLLGADATLVGDVVLTFGAERLTMELAGLTAPLGALAQPARDEHAVPAVAVEHPNGVIAIDHVVAFTPRFDDTKARLVGAGLDHRRDRDAGGGRRQAFFVLGAALLELVGPAGDEESLWGLTFVVDDLDAAKRRLGDLLADPKDAVQPGRRIATVRSAAGLGVPVALMTPR